MSLLPSRIQIELKEPKHSPQFWQLIESIMPSYKKLKDWLFVNGKSLDSRM